MLGLAQSTVSKHLACLRDCGDAHPSTVGLVLAALSLVIMPVLSYAHVSGLGRRHSGDSMCSTFVHLVVESEAWGS